MDTHSFSSSVPSRRSGPIEKAAVLSLTLFALTSGCTQAAGLHEHEAYRGFPDSRSDVLCSGGFDGDIPLLRISCSNQLAPTSQDGHLQTARPEYGVEGKDVRDDITGLAWHTITSIASSHDAAIDVCEFLDGDYRLPSRLELISLLDYGGSDVLIDEMTFKGVEPMRYATSTPYNEANPQFAKTHWAVNFGGNVPFPADPSKPLPGETQQLYDMNEMGVICVRNDSGPFVSGPFEPAGVENRYRRDARTGLLWLAEPIDTDGWTDAITKCDQLVQSGYDDFRLPNAKELATLVDDTIPGNSNSRVFSGINLTGQPYLWSSTPTPDARYALMLSTSGASIAREKVDIDYHEALCVRGPD